MKRLVKGLLVALLVAFIPVLPIKRSNYDVVQSNGSRVHVIYKWMSVTERLTGVPVEAFYVPSDIKSFQSGIITWTTGASATATITAVTVANTMLIFNGGTNTGSNTDPQIYPQRLELTNTTTVTCNSYNPASTWTDTCGWTAIEFRSGVVKSNQAFSFTISSPSTSGTATITSVNTAKATVVFLGNTGGSGVGENYYVYLVKCVLTNATTVTCTRGAAGSASVVVGGRVLEFF